jgi:predicted LPLAT superfamily acyltransferase
MVAPWLCLFVVAVGDQDAAQSVGLKPVMPALLDHYCRKARYNRFNF